MIIYSGNFIWKLYSQNGQGESIADDIHEC